MSLFLKCRSVLACSLAVIFLCTSLGCGYKPSYLQKEKTGEVPNRWVVEKINPSKLSADEAAVYEKMGAPNYVRFFRQLSMERKRVYEWVYLEPVRLVSFVDGKKFDYTELDEETTPWNEKQKKTFINTGIVVGVVAALGAIYYYAFGQK
jgi:hypothetical protein